MTISHVIYLEFARLIVSWQWVTEVGKGVSANVRRGTLLWIFQTDTPPRGISIANLDPSAENARSGGLIWDAALRGGIDIQVTKAKIVLQGSK